MNKYDNFCPEQLINHISEYFCEGCEGCIGYSQEDKEEAYNLMERLETGL